MLTVIAYIGLLFVFLASWAVPNFVAWRWVIWFSSDLRYRWFATEDPEEKKRLWDLYDAETSALHRSGTMVGVAVAIAVDGALLWFWSQHGFNLGFGY